MNAKEMIEHNETEFTITKVCDSGIGMIAVMVNYPNCPHGDKIMVFENVTEEEITSAVRINPHFEKEGITPIARFNPHFDGWTRAISMINPQC
jgi:histone acetyltransferase (RNA polymerase elongator complex component)